MKILFLSAHVPSPVGRLAGQKTSFYICEWLSRRNSVHLLSFGTEAELSYCRSADNDIFNSAEILQVNIWSRLAGVVRDWGTPVAVAARSSAAFRGKLVDKLRAHAFDIAVLDHAAMWQYWSELRTVPLLLGSAHDVLSQLWQRRISQSRNSLSRTILKAEHSRIVKWEQSILGKLDILVPHCEKDALLLRTIAPSMCVCPVRAWFTFSPLPFPGTRDPASVVFTGAFDRSENQDALTYSIQEILPLVRREYPHFKFYITGACTEKIGKLAEGISDVAIMGFLDDLPAFLSTMQLALLPIRLGAGIKVKVLECMAAGLAVVTTAVGAEGVGGEDGVHYLLGETPRELASHVIRLFKNPSLAQELGCKARELVLQQFDFESAIKNLWSVVEGYLSPRLHAV